MHKHRSNFEIDLGNGLTVASQEAKKEISYLGFM